MSTAHQTTVQKHGELDLSITRKFDAPVALVFKAWSDAEMMKKWWAPASFGMDLSCQMDVRPGGAYRFEYSKDGAAVMAFFGHYIDVVPNQKLVWTNEESEGGPVTNVTFTPEGSGCLLTMLESHKSQETRDESCLGMESMSPEQFGQLDALLAALIS